MNGGTVIHGCIGRDYRCACLDLPPVSCFDHHAVVGLFHLLHAGVGKELPAAPLDGARDALKIFERMKRALICVAQAAHVPQAFERKTFAVLHFDPDLAIGFDPVTEVLAQLPKRGLHLLGHDFDRQRIPSPRGSRSPRYTPPALWDLPRFGLERHWRAHLRR